ncbi:MAG: tRNA pseudouridine(38-40) synthase TruA [Bacteroidetes bacterium]|nr:tRNA pseudouridine(38-40) synthase TruA [Bacteroidota bacterium]
MSFRYFIRLSFNGESFHGWQRQNNAHSIQSALKDALTVVLREPTDVTGAGRTDAGVHAREFFAHFDSGKELSLSERKELINHLNGYLPASISIHAILPVTQDAHARFSARSRTYQYFITKKKDPFLQAFSWYYPGDLDVPAMNLGAAILKENLDFTSFAKLPAETKTNICHVENAIWEKREDLLVFTITADRFLRNMVRAVVGTLIDLGRGKITPEDLQRIILSKDRCAAGFSVPASGLFLVSVKYPPGIFLETADDPENPDGNSQDSPGKAESEKKS